MCAVKRAIEIPLIRFCPNLCLFSESVLPKVQGYPGMGATMVDDMGLNNYSFSRRYNWFEMTAAMKLYAAATTKVQHHGYRYSWRSASLVVSYTPK